MLYELDNPDDINPQQPGLGWHSCPKCDGAHRPGTVCRAKKVVIVKPAPAPKQDQEQEGEQLTDAEKKHKLEQVAELAVERGELRLESREKAKALASAMTHTGEKYQQDFYTAAVRGGELRLTIDQVLPVIIVTFASAKQLKLERAQAAIEEAASRMARRPVANTDCEQAAAAGELEYVPLPHVA